MARPKTQLKELLLLLDQKPSKKGEIKKELKISRITEWEILKEAILKKLIEDRLGIYHLAPLGKREIELSIPKFPSDYFSIDVMSQVINVLPLHEEKPIINCTIQIDEAEKIKELDAKTVSIQRFLTRDGLGLVENETYLKSSLALVVDSLLDHKAKSMGLNTLLDLQQLNEFSSNIKSNYPGYDYRKRIIELARTNFRILIEYKGKKWVQKQDFNKLEENLEDSQKFYKPFDESIKELKRNSRIRESVSYLSGYGDIDDNFFSCRLFNSEDELKQRIKDEFKNNNVGNDNEIRKILDNAIEKEYVKCEKKTLYHIVFDNTKAKEFYKSIELAIDEKQDDHYYKKESSTIQKKK